MRRVRSIAVGCIVAFATSLLLGRTHPFGDAHLYTHTRRIPIMQRADIPFNARQTLVTKCADCHSTQTQVPFYGRLAPFSWLMERDIVRGREAMNLSQWSNYSFEEQDAFKVKIFLEAKSHLMPLPQYRIIHWNADITNADIDSLSQWAHQSVSLMSPVTLASAEGDATRGKIVFEHRCTGCHSLDQNREGPRLRGVFGRTSGSVSNFDYSSAIKDAHIVWNEVTLERWLANPETLIPGNNMEFYVAKPQERSDLVRFLKESTDR